MTDRWRVEVDRSLCIGSGLCAATAAGEFSLDSARQSRPVAPEVDASEAVLEAAEGCPAEAITLRVAGTDEAVFPPAE
ncbi:ferredoxin [Phaeacidiphilus oryzae]|uniref:ferredoxin n=1 Tax=Phaeacidiphilus oryzae TaxID=348818 RepID=UPI00056B618E|nr:ferredoxin [Phaeacidiphilus oryzae]